jgi:hypothetical protein
MTTNDEIRETAAALREAQPSLRGLKRIDPRDARPQTIDHIARAPEPQDEASMRRREAVRGLRRRLRELRGEDA